MKNILRWVLGLLMVLLLAPSASTGEVSPDSQPPFIPQAVLPVAGGTVEVDATLLEDEYWLFLPAHADLASLTLRFRGTTPDGDLIWRSGMGETPFLPNRSINWLAVAEASDGVYRACLYRADGTPELALNVMRSENLRAFYLFSDDPIAHGRAWLEDCPRHENETSAAMAIVSPNGHVDHAGDISKLRGRGNGTWANEKRPYQLKLTDKANLLDTGNRDERSRTWVLLAESTDSTFLHNRLALDLGLELGMSETSRSEYVDLYYDGEYRGLYLLCEKVEVNEGRVDIPDYEKMLESWNQQAGIHDLEALEVGKATNRYGNEYAFIKDVYTDENLGAGGYLLEMENEYTTLSNRCWFRLGDGSVIAFKSPENPSQEMVAYVSELLEEGRRIALNGGTDPETGLILADRFDLDSFARIALINELAYNLDGFTHSSSFFVLPEGETRFRAGPAWDFDLAWRYNRDINGMSAACFKSENGWLPLFYRCVDFRVMMQRLYQQEMYPLIVNILLGEQRGLYLRPLDDYAQEIAASQRMNAQIFQTAFSPWLLYGADAQEDLALLRKFLYERSEWMYGLEANSVELNLSTVFLFLEETINLTVYSWSGWVEAELLALEMVSEATETDYAIWRAETKLTPKDGYSFPDNPVIRLNNTYLTGSIMEDGSIRISFTFPDLSYRPVLFEGDDFGLIYDYESYLRNHPEVKELCGTDPEAVLEYFVYEGMYEGHQGNAFFSPPEIARRFPETVEMLGTDWSLYYDELLYGDGAEWILARKTTYRPPVMDDSSLQLPKDI